MRGKKKRKNCADSVWKTEDDCVKAYEDWIPILRPLDIKRIRVKSLRMHCVSNNVTECVRTQCMFCPCSLYISLQCHFSLAYINYPVSLQTGFCLSLFSLSLLASNVTPASSPFPSFSLAESQSAETSCQRGISDSILSLPLPVSLPPFLSTGLTEHGVFLIEWKGVPRQSIQTTLDCMNHDCWALNQMESESNVKVYRLQNKCNIMQKHHVILSDCILSFWFLNKWLL